MELQPAPTTDQTFLKSSPSLKTYIRTPKRYVIAILLVLLVAGSLHTGFLSGLTTVSTSIGTALILDTFISRVIRKRHKHTFPDGALLTGLIIGIVLSPATSFAVSAFTAAAAILSKHVITYQKKPILNPAAFGLWLSVILFSSNQSWWGGMSLLPWWTLFLVVVGGYLVTSRVQKFPQVFAFLAAYGLIHLILGFIGLTDASSAFITPYLNAVLFLAFFMLTDPPTSPAKNRDQIIFGILCAVVSCVDFYLFNSLSYLLTGLLCANAWKAYRTYQTNQKRRATRTKVV
ncbi:RnfABCDGE type electron transport complex subunit D [Bacillus altitudinis MN12]|uniref:RnfABCDGE type electron transport complex subunit D n=1 Tax=Bacillus altitudinis TaxID=293387 RepID=UPI001B815DF6|nr:RnfABCDGE type electron transport complex subunit D [Bacillus altitudinis]MBR0584671.1 RnfABCDGE type electron transport complex subunit D [Bacillus altitudinis MN12]MBR0595592.1 RnfABCDGE type electron transport complex subunit D [Bacillus altitudinis C16B11]MBR0611713.1 RnfABCDGE type electron transport complex subunit D [Bacillus altitudinis]